MPSIAPIELTRTFSEFVEQWRDQDDWSGFPGSGTDRLGWERLASNPLTVVLGEAGIGKTVELELQVGRLRKAGQAAFFLPLNQLNHIESWSLVLGEAIDEYERWAGSTYHATFFLDAVDESRLKSHSDFEKALSVVQHHLRARMERARFVISSRPSDWSLDGVQEAVQRRLCAPLASAQALATPPGLAERIQDPLPEPSESTNPIGSVQPFVVSLDDLSIHESKRLAEAYRVTSPAEFWSAVEDGGFEFMASKPLDLQWLVQLWNEKTALGTYRDLLEFSVTHRLAEVNESYIAAGVALSPQRLREGAERLAAAAELSGRAYISTNTAPTHNGDEISPLAVLDDWGPGEIGRLLATAIFDEASYGRVRFHHRTIRSFLAAGWSNRQLELGVPTHRIVGLHTLNPFGVEVLNEGRRWMLCWLAAINASVREWVARRFPEMLAFDGDPQAWDEPTADAAFKAYLNALDAGFVPNWTNEEAEYRRLGLRLSTGLVAGRLRGFDHCRRAEYALLSLAKYARLNDCAEIVFAIYRDNTKTPRARWQALEVLETIGSAAHRSAITEDLLAGRLDSNSLLAAALACSNWRAFSAEQWGRVFIASHGEQQYARGSIARVIEDDLLPHIDLTRCELLLSAVLAALPRPEEGKRFARFPESDRPERAWVLDFLPVCFERLLELLPTDTPFYSETCLEAAERIEALRDTDFVDREEFARISKSIAAHPVLRWLIALEIARSEDISHAVGRLSWGTHCLVGFDAHDADELAVRANDLAAPPEVREIWFTVGVEVALRDMKGRGRHRLLEALSVGPDATKRAERIRALWTSRLEGVKARRRYGLSQVVRKREAAAKLKRTRDELEADIEGIRDGSKLGALQWLIHFSFDRSERKSFSDVDYPIISANFGQTIADALGQGLRTVWKTTELPDPVEHRDGSLPWAVIVGLAGLNTFLSDPSAVSTMSKPEIELAARLAAWEAGKQPDWFGPLSEAHLPIVVAALEPWIRADAELVDGSYMRGGLQLALQSVGRVRAELLRPLVPSIEQQRIPHFDTLKNIIRALRAESVLLSSTVVKTCRSRLDSTFTADGLIPDMSWLRVWLEEDAPSAYAWFESQVQRFPDVAHANVRSFAKMVADFKWMRAPMLEGDVALLLKMHTLLTRFRPGKEEAVDPEGVDYFGSPVIAQVREAIPGLLVQTPGASAHCALQALVAAEPDVEARPYLAAKVVDHAAREASRAPFAPAEINTIPAPFAAEPKSEAQLFLQVMGRLAEVKLGVEEGPFSDRGLFTSGMEEVLLQKWLAARLYEQPNRKFAVSREEEVDNKKMPDIQAAAAAGKVCIEIKPLSRKGTSYSANSLADTLETQIVGQYLRGLNSRHGVLVLFRLDDKTWDIPRGRKRGHFSDLVRYLQGEADAIRAKSANVDALVVFGIDCVQLQRSATSARLIGYASGAGQSAS